VLQITGEKPVIIKTGGTKMICITTDKYTHTKKGEAMLLIVFKQMRHRLEGCNAMNSNKMFCEIWALKEEIYLQALHINPRRPA
jgi:hypothetical protein